MNWNRFSVFDCDEILPPRPLDDSDDLQDDFPYGWIYVRRFGLFEVTAVGLHEWSLAVIQQVLLEQEGVDMWEDDYISKTASFAEDLLARDGVAYQSSSSRNIFVGKESNLNTQERVRFTRDANIKELL